MKDVAQYYDRLIDEKNDPVYDPPILQEYMFKWDGPRFIEGLQLDKSKSALEIGIGTGRLALEVLPKCGQLTGIDISPKTIERAKYNLRDFENKELICADFLSYDFSKTFNVIYSSLTFLHIENKLAAIQKTASLLDRGGRFVLSISKDQSDEITLYGHTLRLYPDNTDNIKRFLLSAGFEDIRCIETELAHIFISVK